MGIEFIYTAFDKRLIYKLKQYGINKLTSNWISAYLDNRKHIVCINNHYSDWKDVTSGISQGSILGRLLFIIYTNYMPLVCDELADISLFDDHAKNFKKYNKY